MLKTVLVERYAVIMVEQGLSRRGIHMLLTFHRRRGILGISSIQSGRIPPFQNPVQQEVKMKPDRMRLLYLTRFSNGRTVSGSDTPSIHPFSSQNGTVHAVKDLNGAMHVDSCCELDKVTTRDVGM
jgi:hypothetical protein